MNRDSGGVGVRDVLAESLKLVHDEGSALLRVAEICMWWFAMLWVCVEMSALHVLPFADGSLGRCVIVAVLDPCTVRTVARWLVSGHHHHPPNHEHYLRLRYKASRKGKESMPECLRKAHPAVTSIGT
jgi:hypothetical protein